MRKNLIVFCMILLLICMTGCNVGNKEGNKSKTEAFDSNGIEVSFRADGEHFYHNNKNDWNKLFLKGVNIGLTLGTTDLDNPNIDYATYLEWFEQIGKMNANTVKVFTIMNPDFYKALYDYNQKADSPLWLLQGIWFNENYLYDIGDAFDSQGVVEKAFRKNIKETVDIIHGNSDYTDYGELSPAIYDKDISEYVAGYILGLEWPADFVTATNLHKEKKGYQGKYLSNTEKAKPFESFLCEKGDYLITYETDTYNSQTPIAFLNWQSTDVIQHTNEPFEEEDRESVDTETILAKSNYYAGLFAAIDIYPYYPEFMNHQEEYLNYRTKEGKQDTYEAYLADLKKHYSVPLLVAEVGLPTSRGVAHESVNGYHQGGLTETRQGEYISTMINSIHQSAYAGAMIFSWQEEWFKQTWNTIKYAPDNPGQRTPNVMSAEQGYGILAVEPGKKQTYVMDGNLSEWKHSNVIVSEEGYQLYSDYDEGYLYLALEKTDGSKPLTKDTQICLSTVGLGSTKDQDGGINFGRSVDFILRLNDNNRVRLLTDAYYDVFSYVYGYQKGAVSYDEKFKKLNSGRYVPINMFLSNEMYLPEDKKTIPASFYESGLLKEGNTNPFSTEFDNTGDYYVSDNVVEIRIPWYLLNIMNINEKTAIGDFYHAGEVVFKKIDNITLGISLKGQKIKFADMEIPQSMNSSFHTRLKKSYDIIKSCLKSIET